MTGLEEGTAYKARVRARYFNDNGDLEKSGPWSAAEEIAVAQTPLPAKPTGLLTAASHDNVLLCHGPTPATTPSPATRSCAAPTPTT